MQMISHGIFGAIILVSCVLSQTIEDEFNNPCTSARTCRECIQTSTLCAWCGVENFPKKSDRCDMLENLKRKCDIQYISNPKSSTKVGKDDPWTSGGAKNPPVQIKPQSMEFNLRPSEPVNFKLRFQQQANYPVDLYFLLDLSFGMFRQVEARQRLIALGNDIPHSMTDITNNFRLGFGTFVDKLLMPYTAWTDKMLQDRCPISGGNCHSPHDFKNRLNIGFNQSTFASNMESALDTVSQSLDDAEGGLDGLIQALDCDLIGWRRVSRRIIVYSSNSLFHLAGAGKLGGATKQSNLKCNLTASGEYEGEKIYDYPSVSQIASKLRDKNANVIFAVMSNVTRYYKTLGSFLDGAIVGELEDGSKNIVDLIKDKYYELRSRIKFEPTNATHVDVVLKSKCKGNVLKTTAECVDLEIKDTVEFDVTITVNRYLCQGKTGIIHKDVSLNAVGLNEALLVQLHVQCDCECEGPLLEKTNSSNCEGHGTFECGICNCNLGRYGQTCQCNETEISSKESLEQCKENDNDTITCNGNGECICGMCECLPIPGDMDHMFSGDFCRCNNYNCPLGKNKLMCGGSSKGVCKCGKCDCLPGWSGYDCECTTNKDTCLASDGEECNGIGTCKCGRCICNKTMDMYGPTCEDCLTCPMQCDEYHDCAMCRAFGSGTHDTVDKCNQNCDKYDISKKNVLPSGKVIRKCVDQDIDGCTFYFTYEYSEINEVIITVQKTKECSEKVPVAAIAGGTAAAVVLIPLFLICLLIFFRNRRDRKEYSEFMKEREKIRFSTDDNPIYKNPKSTFQNPTYKWDKK